MSSLKIKVDNFSSTSALDRLSSYDAVESIQSLVGFLNTCMIGADQSLTNISFLCNEDPIAAHGHITFSGEISVDDVVSVNGVSFTAKASPTTEFLFQANADPAVSAASFVAKFNASTSAKITSITASNVSGVITLTADEAGAMGNGFIVTKTTGTNVAVTDFAGGSNGTSTTFNV